MDPGVTHKQDSEVKGHDGMGEGTVLGEDDKESEDLDKNDTGRCMGQGQHSRVSFGSGNRMLHCLYPQQVLYQVMGK